VYVKCKSLHQVTLLSDCRQGYAVFDTVLMTGELIKYFLVSFNQIINPIKQSPA